jgi:N-acetylneuraminic acid mutarotase
MERKISPAAYLRLILFGLLATGSIFFLALFLISCDDEETPPHLTVTGFSPVSGKVGAAVTINGTGFSETPASNTVEFNGVSATVISSTSTSISTTVPSGATTGKISVGTGGVSASSADDFTVIHHTITSFTPTSGLIGAPVTITGTDFNTTPGNNIVKFNNTAATVTASTATTLSVTVPAGSTTGEISVSINGITVTSTEDFIVVIPPTLTSFTPASGLPALSTGYVGDEVTITGTNFSTTPANNVVKFNGTAATVTSSTATQIKANVPTGATTGKISVTVNTITVESANTFTVNAVNTWITRADLTGDPRASAAGFVIGEKIYIGTGQTTGNGNKKDFWEYNTANNAWTQKADFPGESRNGASGFAIGSKGYLGIGYSLGSSLKDFYEYNPANNQWTAIKDFEGSGRSGATSFTIGSKGYIARGTTGLELNELWEYDPAANDWTQKANVGGAGRSFCYAFVVNGKAYISGGQGSSSKDFWEYNPATNEWTAKADFGGTHVSHAAAFSIGSKGFLLGAGNKELWQYNSATNEWTKKADLIGTARASALGFNVGNYGYVMMGTTGTFLKDNYQYTPQ